MIGANVATSSAHAALGNGQAVELRHGLVERLARRLREQDARTRAEELARMTLTEETRYEHAELGASCRDGGSTPLRWTRLT